MQLTICLLQMQHQIDFLLLFQQHEFHDNHLMVWMNLILLPQCNSLKTQNQVQRVLQMTNLYYILMHHVIKYPLLLYYLYSQKLKHLVLKIQDDPISPPNPLSQHQHSFPSKKIYNQTVKKCLFHKHYFSFHDEVTPIVYNPNLNYRLWLHY